MLQIRQSSYETKYRKPSFESMTRESNNAMSSSPLSTILSGMKSLSTKRSIGLLHRIVVAIVLIAGAMVVSGCAGEVPLARQHSKYIEVASAQSNDTESNVGSLDVSDSTADPPSDPQNVIEPGDQVQVMVWGYPKFNTTTTVENYGTIAIPLVGNVIAEGLTERQLASEIQERLSEYVKGDARVTISHVSRGKRISVMGAVNKQGNYPALGEVSLVEVIAEAGGTATNADLRHVKIFRQGSHEDAVEVDLQRYLENGNIASIPSVRAGDTVFVPAEQNLIRQVARYGEDMLVLFGFFALVH